METINKSETLILYSDQNDPYFNQALEYYLLTELEQYHQIFFFGSMPLAPLLDEIKIRGRN